MLSIIINKFIRMHYLELKDQLNCIHQHYIDAKKAANGRLFNKNSISNEEVVEKLKAIDGVLKVRIIK